MIFNNLFVVEKTDRLDYTLIKLLNINRSLSKKLIESNAVKVNNVLQNKPGKKIFKGDYIEVNLDMISKLSNNKLNYIKPIKIDFDVIFENDDIIVINKPINIPVHPSYKQNITLINGVVYYLKNINKNYHFVAPVNRLDKLTSGIVIFSKTYKAHKIISNLFKNRKVKKTYLAVVNGKYLGPNIITSYIYKKPYHFRYDSTTSALPNTKFAQTNVQNLIYLEKNNLSVLKIYPVTGRTHQIRVHLSSVGYPILGDTLYGGIPYKRLMLHSWAVEFEYYIDSVNSVYDKNLTKINLQTSVKEFLSYLDNIQISNVINQLSV
ncbi:MAG: RluA family pseudouridine synthase, partial [Candidatus Dojkabacteria bacterium]|nr:RluA family pseudouridine synthase [Candidatus Dojkabacteria bacterium]